MNIIPSGFNLICSIEPERELDGSFKEFYPHLLYDNKDGKQLLREGVGPFCRFRIPDTTWRRPGVYLLQVDEIIKYVGECENLTTRYNTGYGLISPRNCFIGGQSTNCRINSLILHTVRSGRKVYLYFAETRDRFAVEDELISSIKPEWNRQGGKKMNHHKTNLSSIYPTGIERVRTKSSRDKYLPLKEYLMASSKVIETLSFKDIEKILGNLLPKSAYTYAAWWSNGGHSHADSWLKAGWEVNEFDFGKYVIFKKK